MTWEKAAMLVCAIVVAWMVISMLSAIWYGKMRERQRNTRLRVELVHAYKKRGYTHDEAMRMADEKFS